MNLMRDMSPCLTAGHAGDLAYWSVNLCRRLTVNEMMRLQGVDLSRFHGWEDHVSHQQMGKMAGNAMTVTLLRRIAVRMFSAMGYPVRDNDT